MSESSPAYTAPAAEFAASLPLSPPASTAAATPGYALSHTMYRIKDAKKSLDFYTRILGMTLVHVMDFPQWKFTNYFLCFPQSPIPENAEDRLSWLWNQQGLIELCHNYHTELDEEKFPGYKNGNEAEHKGFGHICVLVDHLLSACERFESLGVSFKKRPQDGNMNYIAFILDPDGYWIEIIARGGERK